MIFWPPIIAGIQYLMVERCPIIRCFGFKFDLNTGQLTSIHYKKSPYKQAYHLSK